MVGRRWGQWLARSNAEMNATSGLVALLGGGLTASGIFLAAPVAAAMGGAVVIGALGWAGWKGIPPRLYSAQELIGEAVPSSDVDLITPPITRVGFIGASRVGKTTLLSHMAVRPATASRTDRVTATIIGAQTKPQKFLALYDGAGQKYTQQFDIADCSDVLLIFIDHNLSATDADVDQSRLQQHLDFIDQTRDHITTNRISIRHVHFVLNKSDLWLTSREKVTVRQWFDQLVDNWDRTGISTTSRAEHSNNSPSDVTALITELFRHVK